MYGFHQKINILSLFCHLLLGIGGHPPNSQISFFPCNDQDTLIKWTLKWYYWSDITSPVWKTAWNRENGDFEKEWGPEKLICVPMGTYDVEAVCWGSGICKFDQRPFFCGNLGHLNSLHPPVCHPCRLPSSQNGIFHFSNAVILTHTHTNKRVRVLLRF